MFIKVGTSARRGWTLVEMMVGVGIFSIVGAALASVSLYSMRSFVAISNYALLNKQNRMAMDQMSLEIRQASHVNDVTTNPPSISLLNGDGLTVIYTFNPRTRQLVRDASDGSHQVLLKNCDLLTFDLRQRNPSNGVWGIFPPAQGQWRETTKAIELSWRTSMTISPTTRITSENVQTARIVLRKQKNS